LVLLRQNATDLVKKVGIVGVVLIGIAIVISIFTIFPSSEIDKKLSIFHVTLADPELYQNGVFSSNFVLPSGEFSFSFVPNGDSPKVLEISIIGESIAFHEKLTLEGTLHETGISEYYTWDYSGKTEFVNSEEQTVQILINPNGNLLGTISIDIIIENKNGEIP